MLTPAETASRIVAGITAKVDLDHNTQAVILVEVANGIEADRHALARDISETATALLSPKD